MVRAQNDAYEVPVFRALNYVWTLLGLTAGEWMTAALPGLLYFATAQLASIFAGEVPWQLYGLALLLAPVLVLGGLPLLGIFVGSLVQALLGVGITALVTYGLWLLDTGAGGPPLWPAVPIALACVSARITLQWGQPTGAVGRLFQGLWDAGRYLARSPDRTARPRLVLVARP